jgi:hypothetical protein
MDPLSSLLRRWGLVAMAKLAKTLSAVYKLVMSVPPVKIKIDNSKNILAVVITCRIIFT